jgi:hypothetical protein
MSYESHAGTIKHPCWGKAALVDMGLGQPQTCKQYNEKIVTPHLN